MKLAMFVFVSFGLSAFGQNETPHDAAPPPVQQDKRAFGVVPNYRTVEPDATPTVLTTKRKFTIAAKDSFDFPIYFVTGALSLIGQAQNSNPSFGQGLKGYSKRYVSSYADQAMTTISVEGLFPSMLHMDPRYYRKGSGSSSGVYRFFYALSTVLVGRTDAGHHTVNFPEVLGNASVTALGNVYYKDGVNAHDNTIRFATLIGSDALGNVLKEFWPDVKRKWLTKHTATTTAKP